MTARLALWLLPLLAGAGCTIHTHSGRSTALTPQREWASSAPRTTLITAHSRPTRGGEEWGERERVRENERGRVRESERGRERGREHERAAETVRASGPATTSAHAAHAVSTSSTPSGEHATKPAVEPATRLRTGKESVASHGKVLTVPPRKSGSAPRPSRKGKRVRDDRARLAEMIEHYAKQPPARGGHEQHEPAGGGGRKATLDASADTAQLSPAGSNDTVASK